MRLPWRLSPSRSADGPSPMARPDSPFIWSSPWSCILCDETSCRQKLKDVTDGNDCMHCTLPRRPAAGLSSSIWFICRGVSPGTVVSLPTGALQRRSTTAASLPTGHLPAAVVSQARIQPSGKVLRGSSAAWRGSSMYAARAGWSLVPARPRPPRPRFLPLQPSCGCSCEAGLLYVRHPLHKLQAPDAVRGRGWSSTALLAKNVSDVQWMPVHNGGDSPL